MDQYSSSSSVCVHVLRLPVSICLSFSLTEFLDLSSNKERCIFLYKKVSCLFIMPLYNSMSKDETLEDFPLLETSWYILISRKIFQYAILPKKIYSWRMYWGEAISVCLSHSLSVWKLHNIIVTILLWA